VVEVFKGTAVRIEGICASNCSWVRARVYNFAPGTYTAQAYEVGTGAFGRTTTITVGADGTGTIGDNWVVYGYSNGSVTVTIDGVSGTLSPWGRR
jgi:hypothetical protein